MEVWRFGFLKLGFVWVLVLGFWGLNPETLELLKHYLAFPIVNHRSHPVEKIPADDAVDLL